MQITSDNNEARYTAVGGQTDFVFDFPVYLPGHLLVYVGAVDGAGKTVWGNPLNLNDDYVVEYTDTDNMTGKIALAAGVAEGSKVLIQRQVPLTQLSEYVEDDQLPASVFESDINLGIMIDQQHRRALTKCFKLPDTSEMANLTVPEPEPGKVLFWESAANLGNKDMRDIGAMVLPVSISDGGTGAETPEAALAAIGAEPADADIVKAPGGVLPALDGSRLTGLARGLNVAPQTVLEAPTGSKISGWADGDQDAPVLSLHTASDIGDTYYSAERVDASLAAGEVGVAAGIVVAYAWGGTVYASGASPDGLSVDLSGAADGVYHIYADLNEEGSWAGVGYSALYPAYGTARLTPGSDLYNTATVRMYDGADNEVRRVYVGRVEMAGGVPTSVVEAPIGTSVKIPLGSGANITNSTTYVESNPFSNSASIELEYYYRTIDSATDIRWQRVDSAQFNSSQSRYYGSAPTCINDDVAIVRTANFALAPYAVYYSGMSACPGRIKLTRGF